jgi:predicted deacetylase
MTQSQEFLAWLRGESAIGTEIFLHGYRHWMPELAEGADFKGQRSAWGQWMNKRWVRQEAEFCGLSEREKSQLLKMGLEAFHQAGIPCAGFVAPTWHGCPGRRALSAQEINILETRFFINHLETRRQRFAPPLAWSHAERGQAKLIGGAWWLQLLLNLPLIKVAIHPGDMDVTGTLRILEKVFATGKSSSYRELFEKAI